MQEIHREREDLLLEMEYLRKRLTELEENLARLDEDVDQGWEVLNPRENRSPCDDVFAMSGAFENVLAHGVDLSEGGVCFEVQQKLGFMLRMRSDGDDVKRRVSLAWARRMGDGRTRLGFEFDEDEQLDEESEGPPRHPDAPR